MPILSLIVYSFNESRLVTVWGGFSTKWYGELFAEPADPRRRVAVSLQGRGRSTRPARSSSARSPALVLARFGPFKGRTLLSGMTTAPLVMPEVITGLSLLLLFVAMEQLHRLARRAAA